MLTTKYKTTYDRDINNSYLVLNASTIDVEAYQKMMLINNEIDGLISLNFKSHNGEDYLYYNITSRISLEDYVKKKELGYNDIRKILTSIEKISQIANEYLLWENSFEVNSESIFFEPGTSRCYFIYIPTQKSGDSLHHQVKALIDDLFHYIDGYDERAVNLMHQLKILVEADSFSIGQLNKLLNDFGQNSNPMKDVIATEKSIDASINQKSGGKKKGHSITGKRKDTRKKKEKFIEKRQAIKEVKTDDRSALTTRTIMVVVIQIILILAIYYAVSSGLLYSQNSVQMGFKIGYFTICVTAIEGVLISITLYQGKKKDGKRGKEKATSKHPSSYNKKPIDEGINAKNMFKVSQISQVSKTSKTSHTSHTETLVSEKNISRPYLIKDNLKIPVIKMPFIIGKLEAEVDCTLSNPLVSRIHGEITIENDSYYYKDLNSRNGSYINNEKILSNQKYSLENNTKLSFANEKYVFRLL